MATETTEQITIVLYWDGRARRYHVHGDDCSFKSESYHEAKGYAKGWIDAHQDGSYFRLDDHCA